MSVLPLKKGKFLVFLARMAQEKPRTMRILTGFLPPTSGTARVAGFDVLNQSKEVRKRIGYMPENPPVYGDMTVTSFLRFISRIKGVPKAKEKERIDLADPKMCLRIGAQKIDRPSFPRLQTTRWSCTSFDS